MWLIAAPADELNLLRQAGHLRRPYDAAPELVGNLTHCVHTTKAQAQELTCLVYSEGFSAHYASCMHCACWLPDVCACGVCCCFAD